MAEASLIAELPAWDNSPTSALCTLRSLSPQHRLHEGRPHSKGDCHSAWQLRPAPLPTSLQSPWWPAICRNGGSCWPRCTACVCSQMVGTAARVCEKLDGSFPTAVADTVRTASPHPITHTCVSSRLMPMDAQWLQLGLPVCGDDPATVSAVVLTLQGQQLL